MAKRDIVIPPNNSFKHKAVVNKEKKEVQPGAAIETHKSIGRKFAETFVSEDVDSVKSYIFSDVVVPMVKDMIFSAIRDGAEMMLYGRSGGISSRKPKAKPNLGTVSYQACWNGGAQNTGAQRSSGFAEITFDTRRKASEILEEMLAVVEQYGNISILSYYDIIEQKTGLVVTSYHTDDKYGWTNLAGVEPRLVRGGRFVLTLPKAVLLD